MAVVVFIVFYLCVLRSVGTAHEVRRYSHFDGSDISAVASDLDLNSIAEFRPL